MDRNDVIRPAIDVFLVALRKESVDRNYTMQIVIIVVDVALRKESVDRNSGTPAKCLLYAWSLSARRAWIEILLNTQQRDFAQQSLSARRAWIEISCVGIAGASHKSLSARRAWIEIKTTFNKIHIITGRSPQGERG